MKSRLKNIAIIVLGTSLLVSGFSFIRPGFRLPEAHAFAAEPAGVAEPATPAKSAGPAGPVPTGTVADLPRTIEERINDMFKAAAHQVKRSLIKMFVEGMVKWIEKGGKPQFVTNWKDFAKDTANKALGAAVAADPELSFLCEPFRAQLKLTLPLRPIPKIEDEAECTLNQIGINIKKFRNDFRAGMAGGEWIGYQSMWQPQNNFIGARLIGQYHIYRGVEDAVNAKINQALAGGGFLGTVVKDAIVTPGSTIKDAVSNALSFEIKGVIDSNEVKQIVGTLADAALNSVTKKLTTGLVKSVYKKEETAKKILDNLDKEHEAISKWSFEDAAKTYVVEINKVLSPRDEANNIMNAMIATIKNIENILKASIPPNCTTISETDLKTLSLNTTDSIKKERLAGTDDSITIENIQKLKEKNDGIYFPAFEAKQKIEITMVSPILTASQKQEKVDKAFLPIAQQVDFDNQTAANDFRDARQSDLDKINEKIEATKAIILSKCKTPKKAESAL